jgi:hypothetical protein
MNYHMQMKTTSNESFTDFYTSQLLPVLSEMHMTRTMHFKKYSFKKYGRNLLVLLSILIGAGVLGEILHFNPVPIIAPVGFFFFFYAIIRPIVIVVKRNTSIEPLNERYKLEIVPKIIRHVVPEGTYTYGAGLKLGDIHTSMFSRTNPVPEGFASEDLLYGTRNGCVYRISDIRYSYRVTRSRKQKSGKLNEVIQEFGAYAIFKLPQQVPSQVNMYQAHPEFAFLKQAADSLIDAKKKHLTSISNVVGHFAGEEVADAVFGTMHAEVIRTGHPDFDTLFTIVADNELVVRQIFVQGFREEILALVKDERIQLNLGLYEDELHIALPHLNLFEFSLGAISSDTANNELTLRYVDALHALFHLADLFTTAIGSLSGEGLKIKVK